MKVLIATGIFPPEIGGPATYAAFLANELKDRGDEAVVLPFRDVRGYPRWLRHFIYFVKVVFASASADIIFTQDALSTGIPVVAAAFMNNKPVVMRVTGDHAWEQASQQYDVTDTIDEFQKKKYPARIELMRFLQRIAVRRADVVVTPSNYFNALVSGWLGGTKPVTTIYNGIDLRSDYKKEPKYPEKTIISGGRLVPWKGFDTLIRTLKDMPGWKLLIAGNGPDKDRLIGLAAECGVTDRVTFLGQIVRPELFAHIHRSHVFALMTTFESFSFQIVEAMHVGTPVIASNIGNLPEIVESGTNGLLIDPTDTKSFIEYAERIAADSEFSRKLSEAAMKRAEDFSIQRTIDQLYSVFKTLISSKT